MHCLWLTLLQLGSDFVAEGSASDGFPGQSIPLELTTVRKGRQMVRFRVWDASVTVDRQNFLRQLADHAGWYFDWFDAATCGTSSVEHEQIAGIRRAAAEWTSRPGW